MTVESVCRRTRESKTRKGCVAVKPCTRIPSLSLSPLWSRSKRRSRRRRRKASTTCAAAACCGSCKNKMGLWGRKAYFAFSTRHCCLIYLFFFFFSCSFFLLILAFGRWKKKRRKRQAEARQQQSLITNTEWLVA